MAQTNTTTNYHQSNCIRALDPDATAVLEAKRKRVRESETRACAEVARANGMSSMAAEKAILAPSTSPKWRARNGRFLNHPSDILSPHLGSGLVLGS